MATECIQSLFISARPYARLPARPPERSIDRPKPNRQNGRLHTHPHALASGRLTTSGIHLASIRCRSGVSIRGRSRFDVGRVDLGVDPGSSWEQIWESIQSRSGERILGVDPSAIWKPILRCRSGESIWGRSRLDLGVDPGSIWESIQKG